MAKVQDAVEILLALDVQEIIDLVDRDQTGEQSAQHLAARLRGTPIALTTYRLPATRPPKGDSNDLWRWCGYDPEKFRSELNDIIGDKSAALLHQEANTAVAAETPPLAWRADSASRETPYRIDPEADLELDLEALEALISARFIPRGEKDRLDRRASGL